MRATLRYTLTTLTALAILAGCGSVSTPGTTRSGSGTGAASPGASGANGGSNGEPGASYEPAAPSVDDLDGGQAPDAKACTGTWDIRDYDTAVTICGSNPSCHVCPQSRGADGAVNEWVAMQNDCACPTVQGPPPPVDGGPACVATPDIPDRATAQKICDLQAGRTCKVCVERYGSDGGVEAWMAVVGDRCDSIPCADPPDAAP
jgi:hypothetical protein